jgi:hypothetical protein
VTLNGFKNVLKASSHAGQTKQEDGFKEVRSRKRHSTGETARASKKASLPASSVKVVTKNFFVPLRTRNMNTDVPGSESKAAEEVIVGK